MSIDGIINEKKKKKLYECTYMTTKTTEHKFKETNDYEKSYNSEL